MRAYSEDLRKKVVEAVKRGMKKSEAAYTFGLSLSSVKRYVGAACEGRSLRPKKQPGMSPKIDSNGRRLLEADLQERPAPRMPGSISAQAAIGWRRRAGLVGAWALFVLPSSYAAEFPRNSFSRHPPGRIGRWESALTPRPLGL